MSNLAVCKLCEWDAFEAIHVKCINPKCSLCDVPLSKEEWQTLHSESVDMKKMASYVLNPLSVSGGEYKALQKLAKRISGEGV